MTNWYLSTNTSSKIKETFPNLTTAFNYQQGEIVSASSISEVRKCYIDNICIYIKKYFSKGKSIPFFAKSRAETEWNNLKLLKKLNIPTPEIIAYGKESNWNEKNFKSILITEAVANSIDLKNFNQQCPEIFQSHTWRQEVILLIAKCLRMLHQNNFIHHDLHWRNILVTKNKSNPKVYFFDMPSGRKKYLLLYAHGVKRDLYSLYKDAIELCSNSELLYFYMQYKNITHLRKKDKQEIKDLISYYHNKQKYLHYA